MWLGGGTVLNPSLGVQVQRPVAEPLLYSLYSSFCKTLLSVMMLGGTGLEAVSGWRGDGGAEEA